jgi:hypothetical protein
VGQTTNEIESQLVQARDDLGANLHELEQKVKDIGDWRHHFRNHPMTMIGVAFGGGVLLATMVGGKRSAPSTLSSSSAAPVGPYRRKTSETWDHIRDTLIGMAATRVTDFVGEVVPGFAEEFRGRSKAPSS